MDINSTTNIIIPNAIKQTDSSIPRPISYAFEQGSNYSNISSCMDKNPMVMINSSNHTSVANEYINSIIERVAQWFLSLTPLSNKKLQKLCYYAYCWFIVFNNDLESIIDSDVQIQVLCADRFQAWIHGPVCPRLYNKYKEYGWHDIPQVHPKPKVSKDLESLLEQVWEAYGAFTADELEIITHNEMPWKNARKGYHKGDACSNEISDYDILRYYSNL